MVKESRARRLETGDWNGRDEQPWRNCGATLPYAIHQSRKPCSLPTNETPAGGHARIRLAYTPLLSDPNHHRIDHDLTHFGKVWCPWRRWSTPAPFACAGEGHADAAGVDQVLVRVRQGNARIPLVPFDHAQRQPAASISHAIPSHPSRLRHQAVGHAAPRTWEHEVVGNCFLPCRLSTDRN